MATEEFLRKGINCIEYKDGKRVNIADYVQMELRTAATRSYLQGEAKRELNWELIPSWYPNTEPVPRLVCRGRAEYI